MEASSPLPAIPRLSKRNSSLIVGWAGLAAPRSHGSGHQAAGNHPRRCARASGAARAQLGAVLSERGAKGASPSSQCRTTDRRAAELADERGLSSIGGLHRLRPARRSGARAVAQHGRHLTQDSLRKEGWLSKLGGSKHPNGGLFSRRNWKRRWFQLHGSMLKYFKAEGAAEPGAAVGHPTRAESAAAGWLELGPDTFVREEDETAFAIIGPARTHYIVADTSVCALDDWSVHDGPAGRRRGVGALAQSGVSRDASPPEQAARVDCTAHSLRAALHWL